MNCADIQNRGNSLSGVYTIKTRGGPEMRVYCDMKTDGGGWLVFQRRQDGSQDFFLTWREYASGFGDLSGEFWLGNRNLHVLTSTQRYEMRVDLRDLEGETRFARYSTFRVASEDQKFALTVKGYSDGTAGDAMRFHNGQAFTTKDMNNDVASTISCANLYKGAWWYKDCYHSNLNGLYLNGTTTRLKEYGVEWLKWKYDYSMPFAEMKIRPIG
ncbi:hypothetical protein CAPTEDRAFT_142228 [Capitella teleta]|uniref:Fibrinogen C-terminal domain-containing protein n=1 Tax=Capitella teleta TaxID=283909 RepID=R7U9W3_CAPTE|nr:hypothetical protein CAPTEDRAFT_142228 [Capitella teleta]|eukprot:ELU02779.1 hypothetical protein CAPTEDRAFT_142228 [Capitella teleta]